MTFSRAFCLAVTACLVAGTAVPGHAGVADTPLPTFADGKPAQLAVMLPAVVKDNNLRTYVVCTNLGATPVDVGLEVFDQGGVRGNTVAAGNGALLDVAAGRTVTFSTGTTVVMHEEVVINLEPPVTVLGQGSGRVVTTGLQVACTAYAVDRLHQIRDPRRLPERPPSITVLPVQPACTPAACADADPCTVDACDHAGVCTHTVVADGTPCDDGNACTTGEACFADQCIGSPVSCDDGNVCTTDTCDPASGCLHTPVPECSSTTTSTTTSSSTTVTTSTLSTMTTSTIVGVVTTTSTTAETSSSTTTTLPGGPACVLGTSSGCEDGDPCTVDTCTAGRCLHEPTTGFAAVACLLPETGLEIAPCAGERIPRSVTLRYAQGRSLVGRAAQSGRIEQGRQLVGKAAKVLQGAARRVTTAGTHGRLSPACADVLGATLQEAADLASRLAAAP
ncbi:MAG: hypothetical protein E6J81_15205 [Deltaproteobacteria bacterium]|nr:MAG: hypothetical protein E6J81_15205 [Deltaproteobacteria bacterium]